LRGRREPELDVTAASLIEDLSDTPEVAVVKEQQKAAVARCLDGLSPAHRELICRCEPRARSGVAAGTAACAKG